MRNLLVWCLRDRSAAVLSSHLNIQIYPIQRLYGTDANVVNVDETTTTDGTNAENPQKLVRVAVIGTPNAGKSTFINSVVNHRVMPFFVRIHYSARLMVTLSLDLCDIEESTHYSDIRQSHSERQRLPNDTVRHARFSYADGNEEIQFKSNICQFMPPFDSTCRLDCCCSRCVQFIHTKYTE